MFAFAHFLGFGQRSNSASIVLDRVSLINNYNFIALAKLFAFFGECL